VVIRRHSARDPVPVPELPVQLLDTKSDRVSFDVDESERSSEVKSNVLGRDRETDRGQESVELRVGKRRREVVDAKSEEQNRRGRERKRRREVRKRRGGERNRGKRKSSREIWKSGRKRLDYRHRLNRWYELSLGVSDRVRGGELTAKGEERRLMILKRGLRASRRKR
jgi:hypothetical protein